MELPTNKMLSRPIEFMKNLSEDGVLPLNKLFSPHRFYEKLVRGWGASTQQAFFNPSNLWKACPRMGYSHSTSFSHPICFENASDKMEPRCLSHPFVPQEDPAPSNSNKKAGPTGPASSQHGHKAINSSLTELQCFHSPLPGCSARRTVSVRRDCR